MVKGKSRHEGGSSNQSKDEKAHIAFITKGKTTEHNPDVLSDKWFLDSCASQHMCNNLSAFRTLKHPNNYSSDVETAKNYSNMSSKGVGTVMLQSNLGTGNNNSNVLLKDVAYVPDLRTNLISVAKMQRNGISVSFPPNSNTLIVSKDGSVCMEGTTTTHNIEELTRVTAVRTTDGQLHAYISTAPNMRLLHKRLGQ